MNRRLIITATAVALMLSSLISSAAVAAAGTPESGPYGTQLLCKYRSFEVEGTTGFRLRRVAVDPPTDLYARRTEQTVGWRLLVQRRYDGENWKRIFASVIQKSTATPTEPGVFSQLFAKIDYIDGIDRWPNGRHSEFRAVLKFYWYRKDGTIATSERYANHIYHAYRDGEYQFTSNGSCEGAWLDP